MKRAREKVITPVEGIALPADEVLALAKDAGFTLAGLARPAPIQREALTKWLAEGHHAGLTWMADTVEERLDITRLFPAARTVLALAVNYWQSDEPSPLARYARGRDYHGLLRDGLRRLRRNLKRRWPFVGDYGSVDMNPLMEKVWAVRAGLGTIGKNGCLITKDYGSWVLLAVMVLNVDVLPRAGESGYPEFQPLEKGAPLAEICGRCRLCIDACPTGALLGDQQVDARRCISYHTIESTDPLPARLDGYVFGCDRCQEVCPHNQRTFASDPRFRPRPAAALSLEEWTTLSEEDWARVSPGTPLVRAGRARLRESARVALAEQRGLPDEFAFALDVPDALRRKLDVERVPLDADEGTPLRDRSDTGSAAPAERVEHRSSGSGAGVDDALKERERLLGGVPTEGFLRGLW